MPAGGDEPDRSGLAAAPLSAAIFQLARAHRAYAAELLREHGLHPGQELVLLHLLEQDHRSQGALLEAVGLDHSTLSRSLSRMEAAGLVRRRPSEQDRRAVVVSLTPKGERLRQPLHDVWAQLERTTTQGLSGQEVEALTGALTDVRRAVVDRARHEGG